MNVGIVGLGLIGGSVAKAAKLYTEHTIWGRDLQESVLLKARLLNAIDDELTDERISACDMLLIALYPADTVNFVREFADKIKKGAIVVDLCGVKEVVCSRIQPIAKEYGFFFVGGHPMAGRELTGFIYSKEDLFRGASMILTPLPGAPIALLQQVKQFFTQLGFRMIQLATPAEHDRMIAFTSQLAHVVSSAYIKSPTAVNTIGFSAGSFKDMTRVAKLNETMWTELFLSNRAMLVDEIEGLIARLEDYKRAIADGDQQMLYALLKEGRERKAVVDGEIEAEI